MVSVQGLTAFILLALSVRAQVPAFKGQLLLEPGLNGAKCLTASSNTDGATVTIQTCIDSEAQKWTFTGGPVQAFGNKCLDVTNGNKADSTELQIWSCTPNDPNQQFSYTRDNRLIWLNTNKCVDLTDGNQGDGTPAQIWDYNGGINQVWNTGYSVDNLPQTSADDQYGINNCGGGTDVSGLLQSLELSVIPNVLKLLTAPNLVVVLEPSLTEGATQSEDLYTETHLGQVSNTMTGQNSSLTVYSAFALVLEHAQLSCVTISMMNRDANGTCLRTTMQTSTKTVTVTLINLWESMVLAHGINKEPLQPQPLIQLLRLPTAKVIQL